MNPETNRFEPLIGKDEKDKLVADELRRAARALRDNPLRRKLDAHAAAAQSQLLRPNGEPVPAHWSIFTVGELLAIKGHTFRVDYIGEQVLLLVPIGPVVVGEGGEAGKGMAP